MFIKNVPQNHLVIDATLGNPLRVRKKSCKKNIKTNHGN